MSNDVYEQFTVVFFAYSMCLLDFTLQFINAYLNILKK